jgi:hypothetical protein
VKYVEFKRSNGGVKHPYSECVKNYEEKHKLKLRCFSTTRTKPDFGILLNHTGDNISEENSNPCDNLTYPSHLADVPVSEVTTLPKKASRVMLPRISLSSIQQMASPIMEEPNWIDIIQGPITPTTMLLPLEPVPVNGFHEDSIHNYHSERTAIAAEGMLMLSTPSSCSSGTTTPVEESFETIDNI